MGDKYRFLFIEDQIDDALLLARRLEVAGYNFDWKRVDTEPDLESALDGSWDMVFSDYTMPSLDGMRALEIVRQKAPDVPFIYVSGTIGEETAVEGMRRGAQDFVMKGNTGRLLPVVDRELRKQEDYRHHRITERERSRFAEILKITPDLIAFFKQDGLIEYMNDSGQKLTGMPGEYPRKTDNIIEIFPDSDRHRFNSEIIPTSLEQGFWSGEATLLTKNEALLPVSIVVLAHRDSSEEIDFFSINIRDISERKSLEEKLQYKAYHDNLTDLPNRYFLAETFSIELQRARRNSCCVGVIFLDINNFKRINDSLGHEAGDILLQQVAKRLQATMSPNDTVARFGGDKFTVLAGDLDTPEGMLAILSRLKMSVEAPILLNSHEIFITFSAGIAVYPYDGYEVTDLLRNADVAMNRAKQMGADQHCFYTSKMNERSHEMLSFDAALRHALVRNEYVLHYQPQINLRSGKITGLEVLLRWQHPQRGLVSPAEFIPILENNGTIIQVGEWILSQACQDYKLIHTAGYRDLHFSVNVSAVQFNDDIFLERISSALEKEKVPASTLVLEITENILMHNPERTAGILTSLSSMGIRVAIDDFGTGYSSLAYLKRFPLHVLKIDKTFIEDIETDQNDCVIVEASITLGKRMGLEIVAEGVETEAQLNLLKENLCDIGQGYYFSKPLPLSELMKLF